MKHESLKPIDELDRLRTIKEAAEILGIKIHKIRRAIRLGLLRYYSLLDKRRYVKLRDILDLVRASA